MHFNIVDFPDPFSPMMPKVSPGRISKLTSSMAQNSSNFATRRRMSAAFSELLRS